MGPQAREVPRELWCLPHPGCGVQGGRPGPQSGERSSGASGKGGSITRTAGLSSGAASGRCKLSPLWFFSSTAAFASQRGLWAACPSVRTLTLPCPPPLAPVQLSPCLRPQTHPCGQSLCEKSRGGIPGCKPRRQEDMGKGHCGGPFPQGTWKLLLAKWGGGYAGFHSVTSSTRR